MEERVLVVVVRPENSPQLGRSRALEDERGEEPQGVGVEPRDDLHEFFDRDGRLGELVLVRVVFADEFGRHGIAEARRDEGRDPLSRVLEDAPKPSLDSLLLLAVLWRALRCP